MISNIDNFNDFFKRYSEFSNETFGTPEERDCISPLRHLQEEVVELMDNPNDELEWADCFLLLLDAARRKGHSLDDLIKFANTKLEINKKRSWVKDNNGIFKHVK